MKQEFISNLSPEEQKKVKADHAEKVRKYRMWQASDVGMDEEAECCEDCAQDAMFESAEELNEDEVPGNAKLNKPFRAGDGKSKFIVYVKNSAGNVVKVRFGDPNMEIKRDDPDRRASFRARHNCDSANDRTSARYWSCKMWQANKSVSQMTNENMENENLDEAISASERIKRSARFRAHSAQIHNKAKIAAMRAPSMEKLLDRSRRMAIRMMKERIGKKKLDDMSPSEHARVEDAVKRIPAVVERLARKLLPKVKQHSMQRMKAAHSAEAAASVKEDANPFFEKMNSLLEKKLEKIAKEQAELLKKKTSVELNPEIE